MFDNLAYLIIWHLSNPVCAGLNKLSCISSEQQLLKHSSTKNKLVNSNVMTATGWL